MKCPSLKLPLGAAELLTAAPLGVECFFTAASLAAAYADSVNSPFSRSSCNALRSSASPIGQYYFTLGCKIIVERLYIELVTYRLWTQRHSPQPPRSRAQDHSAIG